MNLRHHFTHQIARRDAATFWAGCGAVRRAAFVAAGGFDAERYPNGMEDTELGLRLAGFGRTRLDPALQVTHLKRWTARSVIETEILRRAIPWSRIVWQHGRLPDDLNLRRSQRVAALLAPFALASVAALPLLVALGAFRTLLVALALLAASVALSADMLRLFARRRGAGFALAAWLFHQVHLVYSASVFAHFSLGQALRRAAGAA
jgi:GT2 family glycosyltransferase